MSSVHCVVVWEWQCAGGAGGREARWLPHAPGVARTLERAHGKQLTRVVLSDAEPELRGHYVNLRTLTQSSDTPDGGVTECLVRRACYSLQSPAARGARWEWARVPPRHQPARYDPLPMQVQCVLEDAWTSGAEQVSFDGWAVSLLQMSARAAGGLRILRRAPQAPYPLVRSPTSPPSPPTPPARTPVEGRRTRIPQQHTGSSVHSVQSARCAQPAHAQAHAAPCRGGARSASPRERKPGLARQILHNLNIFSHSNKGSVSPDSKRSEWERERDADRSRERAQERQTDTECGSTRSGRRHSVDTVSTYLSHESKDGSQAGACTGELLNCSAGSDDVFAPPAPPSPPPPPPPPPPRHERPAEDTIIGIDSECSVVCSWVRAVPVPQWGALCPACRAPLAPPPPAPAPPGAPCVALVSCQHLLHLHCLNDHLQRLRNNGESLYIECLVCGHLYGRRGSPAMEEDAEGSQPAGSMAWCARAAPLPSHPAAATLLVTYNFQSGRQGARHPAPGARYYAVGFPRHSVLPDTELGRQVLMALRRLWERGSLFTVRASQTTGREHVVCWRAPPPPASPRAYPPDPALADRLLAGVLARLHALLPPQCRGAALE